MTRVIKIGGRVQRDPALSRAIADAWRATPQALCVVHGGGDEVTALQRLFGHEPMFQGGRRVTTAGDIDTLRMVLSGSANKRLVAALTAEGVHALGISGEDAALIGAELDASATLGLVGTPTRINVALLRHLMGGGYMPVISPMAHRLGTAAPGPRNARPESDAFAEGSGPPAGALNVNGDDAAAAIAVALEADELLLVADVAGVCVNGVPVPELTASEAQELIDSGQAAGGMAAKLEAAFRALSCGVSHVRIGDLAAITDTERGTIITHARSFA